MTKRAPSPVELARVEQAIFGEPKVGEDLVEAFEEMAAYMRGEVQCESYHIPEPDVGHYAGWVTALIWVGLLAMCWAPVIGAVYLTWSWI